MASNCHVHHERSAYGVCQNFGPGKPIDEGVHAPASATVEIYEHVASIHELCQTCREPLRMGSVAIAWEGLIQIQMVERGVSGVGFHLVGGRLEIEAAQGKGARVTVLTPVAFEWAEASAS